MPLLKGLTCSIEPVGIQEPLQEYGTSYGDGFVETFVAVPSKPRPFTVHLKSFEYIAPGLAMYVFIDGVYQCNRNRQELRPRDPHDTRSLVDFRVRQKEEKRVDGSMIAREWIFEKLNIVNADNAPDMCSPNILDNIGCIEVVVLRCAGPRNSASSEQNLPSAFGMDGASDAQEHHFGADGQSREWSSGPPPDYAELFSSKRKPGSRSQRLSRPSSSYAKTTRNHPATVRDVDSQLNGRDDSPSIIERLHTKRAISPGFTMKGRVSPAGFRYGSGPVPHATKAESDAELFRHRTPGSINTDAPIVDPQWLEQFVAKAVERKLEEKSVEMKSPHVHRKPSPKNKPRPEVSRPPPGAWPVSPFGAWEQPSRPIEDTSFGYQREPSKAKTSISIQDGGPAWSEPNVQWEQANTGHVQWANAVKPGVPSWNTAQNHASDSWETSSWGTNGGKTGLPLRRSNPSKWSDPNTPNVPPVSIASLSSRRSTDDWVQVDSLSNSPSGFISTKSDNIVVRQPQRINNEKNSQPNRRKSSQIDIAQWGANNNPLTWGTHNNNGWTDRDIEENISTSSSTWGNMQPVDPTPSRSTPVRRNSRSDQQQKKTKREAATPPVPTWGCAIPHKSDKLRVASAHMPPPAYSLEAWMRSSSIGSSASRPWHEAQKHQSSNTSDSWNIGGQTDKWTGDWKNGAQNSWEGAITNDISSSWGNNGISKNEHIKSGGRQEVPISWNNGVWGTSHRSPRIQGTRDQPDNMFRGWGEANNSKEQDSGWETPIWNNKKQLKDQYVPTPAWYIPKVVLQEKSNNLDQQPLDNNNWNSTPSPKAHWKFPPPPSKRIYPISEDYDSVTSTGHRKIWTIPEEPLYSIPAAKAKTVMLEHQVRAGKGTKYHHLVGRPRYVDSLEKPYAVFRFKYRTREALRSLLGSKVVPEEEKEEIEMSVPSPPIAEVLEGMSKAEVVARFVELNNRLKEKEKEKEGTAAKTPTVVQNWVSEQQARSRDASLHEMRTEKKPSVQDISDWGDLVFVKPPPDSGGWGKADTGQVGANASWGNADNEQSTGNNGWSGGGADNNGWGSGEPTAPNTGWQV